MGRGTNDNGDCRRLQKIEAVLREQLAALDTCGSSIAGAHLSLALEAVKEDLTNRCGTLPDARSTSPGRVTRKIFRLN